MGGIDVKIVVELWQVVFASLVGCITLVGVGFGAAVVFVRKSDCESHRCEEDKKYETIMKTIGEIFTLMREVKSDVDILKGKQSAVHQ